MAASELPVKARDEVYHVLMEISRGAYGDVFLCERKADGAKLCMKEVEFGLLSAAERNGCLAEVELFLRLPKHPHIVGFHEAFWETPDQTLLIVLEYGDAGDLEGFVQSHRHEEPSERAALHIFHQIARGVQFLHRHHVLHRDLKAKNVFLFQDGRAVIGDFGTSKTLASASGLGSTVVGSPLYMSPEILEGEPHSFATDIWSLGCILYELLTWRSPFTAPSYPAVVFKVTQGIYKPLDNFQFSQSVRELVAQMLEKKQHKRPTIEDILLDLDIILQQQRGGFQQDTGDIVPEVGSEVHPQPSAAVSPLDFPVEHCDSGSAVRSVPVFFPPPAPVEAVNAPVAPPGDAEKPTSAHRVKPTASAVAMLPTSRAKVAHIVSAQRLHLHRQQQQQQLKKETHSSSSTAVYHLDLGLPVPPPRPHQPLLAHKKTTTSIPAKRTTPATAATITTTLPPDSMMIIGRKVDAAKRTAGS